MENTTFIDELIGNGNTLHRKGAGKMDYGFWIICISPLFLCVLVAKNNHTYFYHLNVPSCLNGKKKSLYFKLLLLNNFDPVIFTHPRPFSRLQRDRL